MILHFIAIGVTVSEDSCLMVPKKFGEKALRLVRDLKIINNKLKIQQTKSHLLIPLYKKPKPAIIKKLENSLQQMELTIHNFPKNQKLRPTYLDLLTETIPSGLLTGIPRAIDFIGKIAIVDVPFELAKYRKDIGEAILKTHKQTQTVLAKSGSIKGIYRLREFEFIAGNKKTTTIHTEFGCKYYLDIAKTYFSPRLSTEHNRVASNVNENEIIVDLFAGIGPFSILIAKKHKNVKVYAIDINSEAVVFLKRNIVMNRVEKQVIPILGDARKILQEKPLQKADRVIMNLPETSFDYLDVACKALKKEGGIIHYYSFVNSSDQINSTKFRLTKEVTKNKRQIKKILSIKKVREVSPYTFQVVIDAQIQ
jgi:tRNA (guanine37-N1)-methyltransferase